MLKLVLVCILLFGTYIGLHIFIPTSAQVAFTVAGCGITYCALAVALVGYLGWRAIK